jgi:hypothetical protein
MKTLLEILRFFFAVIIMVPIMIFSTPFALMVLMIYGTYSGVVFLFSLIGFIFSRKNIK